jgi:hypothetical protein
MNYLIKATRAYHDNRFSQARKYVQRALQLDPENEKALELMDEIESAERRERGE